MTTIAYIDEFALRAGEIALVAVCPANEVKCVFEPLPGVSLEPWHNWAWDGSAWTQAPDNRGRVWYCASATEQMFVARRPDDAPPAGYLEWLPGQPKVVTESEALRTARDAKWVEIKRDREAALAAPLVTPFGVFDANAAGSANIVKSVLLANNLNALGHPVAIDFTLFDNSVVTLSAAAMVQVGLILAGREQAIRNQATVLRAQIESATADELSAVAWPAN